MSAAPDPLARHMAKVARVLWGEPNPVHSKPGHPRWGNKGSLAVDEEKGVWFNHETGQGGGVLHAVEVGEGITDTAEQFKWLREHDCDVEPGYNGAKSNGAKPPKAASEGAKRDKLESYDYADEAGALLFRVIRFGFKMPDGKWVLGEDGKPQKTFNQCRNDPDDPKLWIWGLGAGEYMRKGPGQDWTRFDEGKWAKFPGTKERKTFPAVAKAVPYRLPELIEAMANGHPVCIVEGERKANALWALGIAATCNSGGAGKWTAEHAEYLRGADAMIPPDNDEAGHEHAGTVAQSLQGIATRIRILGLPGLPAKGDVVDWLKAGGTREQFDALVENAGEWKEPVAPTTEARKATEARGARHAHVNGKQIKAMELNTMTFPPIKYVVPGVLVEGLTILAAKPKVGKSWLALHASIAVASNGFTLGEIHCTEGDVLYCALEDNFRRLQSRMTKLIGVTREWPERLTFLCEMPRLVEGGLQVIREWAGKSTAPRLVVIDTLAMVRAPKKRDESSYDADYNAVKELRALANQYGIAILLIHHQRKQEADDAFDTISGTLGLTGAVDTVLVIKRDASGSMVLHGRGRDLTEIEKAIMFNADACTWTIAGDVSEISASDKRKKILAALDELELPASPHAIATAAELKQANVRKILSNMVDDGTLKKDGYGKYNRATP